MSAAPGSVEPLPAPALLSRRPNFRLQELGLIVVILILYLALTAAGFAYRPPNSFNAFLNLDNQFNGIGTSMSIYAIMAVGMTAVVITGGIDISVGAIFGFSALAGAAVLQHLPANSPWYVALPVAFAVPTLVGGLLGLLNGSLIVGLRMHPFIVTLGTLSIIRAVDAGVAVVCFDSDAPKSKRLCYYGTDDAACGKATMEILAKEMGDKGVVAVLGGNESAPNLRRRVQAARDELKNHPNMKELASGPVFHEETPAKAAEKLQQVQRANPDVAGWCLIGGWPLFTRNALPWQPGVVKVVSVDALPDQLTYLNSGHVQVLLAQDCYGWGHKSVAILVGKILMHKDPEKTILIDPLTQVTKDNAAEWSKKWDKWLKP